MTIKELQDRYPDEFRRLGSIIYALNRTEISVVTALSVFFTDQSDAQSEKNFIFNDALWDENIFPTFETKRRLLIKVIKNLWRAAEERQVAFDKDRWLGLCESMGRVQNARNKLAHHSLGFLPDGKVRYEVRKSNEERLNDLRAGKKAGTLKSVVIDLGQELASAQEVCDKAKALTSEFLEQARTVLAA